MDGEQHKALVAGYLAERDEPCPRCGYNLRGVESELCPECGERLELGLLRRRRLGGWGPFLVLALGWLVLAGGMNAAREVQRLMREREAAIAQNQRIAAVQAQLAAQLTAVEKQMDSMSSGFDIPDPNWVGDDFKKFREQADANFRDLRKRALKQQLAALKQRTPATMRATPTLAEVWLSESPVQRATGVWWVGLALVSLVTLVWAAVAARRGRGAGGLVVAASVLFGLYVAWHVVMLARDVM